MTGEQVSETLTTTLHRANSALSLAQEIRTALHRCLWRPSSRFNDFAM